MPRPSAAAVLTPGRLDTTTMPSTTDVQKAQLQRLHTKRAAEAKAKREELEADYVPPEPEERHEGLAANHYFERKRQMEQVQAAHDAALRGDEDE